MTSRSSLLGSESIRRWAYAQLDAALQNDLQGREPGLSELPPTAVQVILHDELKQVIASVPRCINYNPGTDESPPSRKEIIMTVGTKGGPWAIALALITLAITLLQK